MNPYYSPTPISEKPENDNWYILVADKAIPVICWFDSKHGWVIPKTKYGYKHWLKPVTGVLMTEEEIEKMKREENEAGYTEGYDEGRQDGIDG